MFFTKDLILAQEYLAFLLLNLFDLFLTGYIFKHHGMEANGIALLVLHRYGLLGFAIFKFLLVTVLVLICEVIATHKLKSARMVILLGCFVYGFVVIYESVLIFQHIDRPEVQQASITTPPHSFIKAKDRSDWILPSGAMAGCLQWRDMGITQL